MNRPNVESPAVLVGIDGSEAAVHAALWAVEEAASRETVLRLVHVVDDDLGRSDAALADAEHIIHEAWAAVEDGDPSVKIESEILVGQRVEELVDASRSAALLCVGSGSLSSKLARRALCPVTVVRKHFTRDQNHPGTWVVASLGESGNANKVLQTAISEARIRHGSVLALTPWTKFSPKEDNPAREKLRRKLDHLVEDTLHGHADLVMCTVPAPRDLLSFVADTRYIDQLIVVDRRDRAVMKRLTGSKARAILRKSNCSVMIRGQAED